MDKAGFLPAFFCPFEQFARRPIRLRIRYGHFHWPALRDVFFLPYKFDRELLVTPLLTLLVVFACLGIYAMQESNERKVDQAIHRFCDSQWSAYERMMLARVRPVAPEVACAELLSRSILSADRELVFAELAHGAQRLAGYSAADGERMTRELLSEIHARYARSAPRFRTAELWYSPHSWKPLKMLTASVAHASWSHVIGNLLFFYVFAAAVEAVLGPLAFALAFLVLAFGTHIVYSLTMMNVPEAVPTLGLSGVVMGMMGLLTYLAPSARIRCFYWILIRIGSVPIPAWMLFAWYAGWDAYTLTSHSDSRGINLVAHVSGAVIGYLMGWLLFRAQKRSLALEAL